MTGFRISAESPFRNLDFRRYWGASVISMVGSQLSTIAFPLLVLAITGSVPKAGLLGSCRLLSLLLGRLPAGNLVDRVNQRQLMLGADLARLFALVSIPVASLLGVLSYGQLLTVAVIEGVGTAIFQPASGAALRDVIPEGQRRVALSRVQAAYSTAILVGPLAGGAFYAVHHQLPFLLDAMSYAISASLVVRMTLRHKPAEAVASKSVTAGLRWLASQPRLCRIVLNAALLNMAGAACEIGVVVDLRARHGSATEIGTAIMCAGAGSVIGALLAPRLLQQLRAGMVFLLASTLWTLALLLFSVSPPAILMGIALIVVFVSCPAGGVILAEAIMDAPHSMLGRVSAAVSLTSSAVTSVGPLGAAALISSVGIRGMWLALALVTAVAGLVAQPLWRAKSIVVPDDRPVEAASVAPVAQSLPEVASSPS